MPGRDGTGPMGCGTIRRCLGLGYRRGIRKDFAIDLKVTKTQKELLQEQKELLESRLDIISKQLESL